MRSPMSEAPHGRERKLSPLIYFKSMFEIYSKFGKIFVISLRLILRPFNLDWMFSVVFSPSFLIMR